MRVTLVSVVVAAAAFGAAAARPATPFVVARAPLGQTVHQLLRGRAVEDVVCARACTVTTSVLIRRGDARRLGLKNVQGDWYEIATASGRLRAGVHRKLRIRLAPRAATALGRAPRTLKLQILGRVEATGVAGSPGRGSAAWIVTLE